MTDIQKIIKNNKIYRFALELQYTENDESKQLLKNILENFEQTVDEDNSIVTNKSVTKSNIEKFNDKMNKIDNITLKKQFYRLNEIQKINKLQEYFKIKKNIDDDLISQKFAEEILQLIKEDKLKNKNIEYIIDDTIVNNIKNIDIVDNKLQIITKSKKIVKKTLKKIISDSK
jgi:hypothetical protein